MPKLGPQYEETEIRLVFGGSGKVNLVAVITTGKYVGIEIIIAHNITLETQPENMIDYVQPEVADAASN